MSRQKTFWKDLLVDFWEREEFDHNKIFKEMRKSLSRLEIPQTLFKICFDEKFQSKNLWKEQNKVQKLNVMVLTTLRYSKIIAKVDSGGRDSTKYKNPKFDELVLLFSKEEGFQKALDFLLMIKVFWNLFSRKIGSWFHDEYWAFSLFTKKNMYKRHLKMRDTRQWNLLKYQHARNFEEQGKFWNIKFVLFFCVVLHVEPDLLKGSSILCIYSLLSKKQRRCP